MQQCLPERVLGDCDCAAATRPSDAGRDAATPAMDSAIDSKTSAGAGGGSSAGSGGSGGQKADASSTLPQTDDDSGTASSPMMGGTGGVGGMGGAGGVGGMGGAGAGAAGSMSTAYTACSSADDCRPSSDCTNVPADMLLGTPDYSVCAPPCTTVADCPVPEGGYEAEVVCDTDQLCHLDCTPVALADRSCPSGMTCVTSALTSFCFH
jgi:hypothetical protein